MSHVNDEPRGLRAVWHRLACPACREAARLDARIDRGVREFRATAVPAAGLDRTLAALGLEERPARPRSAAVLAAAAGGLAVLSLALQPNLHRRGLAGAFGKKQPERGIARGAGFLARALPKADAGTAKKDSERLRRPRLEDGTLRTEPTSVLQPARRPLPHPQAGTRGYLRTRKPAPREAAVRTVHTVHSPAESPDHGSPSDQSYLDGRDPRLATDWVRYSGEERERLQALLRSLPAVRDDFVRVPAPRLAASGPGQDAALRAALIAYAQQAKVVDARLVRKVTLQLKAASLEETCAELERQTGVRFSAARGVRDEKVTLFVDDTPVRDVMRAVARLFGFFWTRGGEEGAYRYELTQDLRSQLAEEEMRAQDVNAALLSLDAQMEADRRYLDLSLPQLRERLKSAQGEEKRNLARLLKGGWGGLQLYHRLPPAQRAALRHEGSISFSTQHPNPDFRIPPELVAPLLEVGRMEYFDPETGKLVADADRPGAEPAVMLQLDRSEAGVLTLQSSTFAIVPGRGGFSDSVTLATGRSPSTESPDNARQNAALRSDPQFRTRVTLEPRPGCPFAGRRLEAGTTYGNAYLEVLPPLPEPHLSSADVWEDVHRKTGLPVIADSYSRVYAAGPFQQKDVPVFDALCRAGDALGVRWRKDGAFLLGRSSSFFWDKLKEVPNRYLRRWAADRSEAGLPLEDVLEMATFAPSQLDSERVGAVLRHCWGLEEWMLAGGGDANSRNGWRERARFLAALPPASLRAARSTLGLDFGTLPAPLQEEARRTVRGLEELRSLAGARLQVEWVPAGWYTWVPHLPSREASAQVAAHPIVAERTREAALAMGRRYYPASGPDDVRRSTGLLGLTLKLPDGRVVTEGVPGALVPFPGQ